MALLGSIPKIDSGNFSSRFELGCRLLERGAHADAYLLFLNLYRERERHVAVLYNLALCHVAAGEWEPALRLLERAMAQLRLNTAGAPSKDPTYQALVKRQGQVRLSVPAAGIRSHLASEYTRMCLRLMVDAVPPAPFGSRFRFWPSSFLIRTISMSSAPESLWKSKTKPRRRKTLMPFCNIKATALFAFFLQQKVRSRCSGPSNNGYQSLTCSRSLSRKSREIAQMPARATSV